MINKFENRVLTAEIVAPGLIGVDDFFNYATEPIKAIDFMYALLYFISVGEHRDVINLCKFINQNPELVASGRREFFNQLNDELYVPYHLRDNQPIKILSVHYGSNISFDLLGVGNILEFVRDIVKDALWKAEHEKLLAKSERDLKSTEIVKAKLEIAEKKMALEKMGLELALQRIELVEKIYKLPLNNEDQMAIASVLAPNLIAIVNKETNLSIANQPKKAD